ncbi:fimbrial protein [Limnobaculum xujianqingii]|uniref:fimbrial protein n=1 Tax=Limnobaculum xujianqingii TaxID=2738837 RepID=UPI001128F42D|nr:fimbrial protein [Limnobaculum xujianqingii]
MMQSMINVMPRGKRKIGLPGQVVLGLLALVAVEAKAATCAPYDPAYYRDISVPVVGPGIASVGEEVAVGSIIYYGSYQIEYMNMGWRCTWAYGEAPVTIEAFTKVNVISQPSGAPVLLGGKTVFPTNIPGIGMAVQMSTGIMTSWQYPVGWIHTPYVSTSPTGGGMSHSPLGHFNVQLIKTGPISTSGTQQVLASSFPVFEASQGTTAPSFFSQKFWTVRFNGAINIVTKTCQVEDVDVDLGSHQLSDFPTRYSTSEWKDFNITLKNCPPFHGYMTGTGRYIYDEKTGQTTSSGSPITANKLNFSFTSVHGNYNTYAANTETGPGTAEGFAIQMATQSSSNANISLTSNVPHTSLGITLTTNDGANYVIPLKARYYRYGETAKAGKANGAVTYTVNYY